MVRVDVLVPFTIVVTICFSIASLYSEVKLLGRLRSGASQINISGRQRMLSQRISFLSTIDADGNCFQEAKEELDEALADFLTVGKQIPSFCLQTKCIDLSNQALDSLYHLTDSIEGVSGGTTPCGVFDNANEFLGNMEMVVASLEGETSSRVDELQITLFVVQIVSAIVVSVLTIVYAYLTKRANFKSSEKVDRMVQYLFHEIRNPLNHVVNGIDHILRTENGLSDLARNEMEQCALGGVLITSILNDVLTLASLESKSHEFDESPTSIQKILVDTARVASLSALSNNTVVETEVCAESVKYYDVDGTKLSQVLMNLVTNAVKYAGHFKKIVVGASLVHRGNLKDDICFHVTDNGKGISPASQQQLFEKFRTFSRNSGTGIGLHITQVIVQKMGGSISVISPLPDGVQGSRFEFTLPLIRSTTEVLSDSGSDDVVPNIKILIADDEEINCVILERKFLSEKPVQFGWTTKSVFTLKDVLEEATTSQYDVILLDEHFGNGQKGSLYIETLRKNGVVSNIIIASANCSSADNKLYMGRGAAGTIPKPTPSADILVSSISRLFHS